MNSERFLIYLPLAVRLKISTCCGDPSRLLLARQVICLDNFFTSQKLNIQVSLWW